MIIRIVKMTFDPDKVNDFLKIFEASKQHIMNMEGCSQLDLLVDIDSPNIFFTYSHWQSVNDLNNYRCSKLFETVWSNTKRLFSAKAEAWSVKSNVPH